MRLRRFKYRAPAIVQHDRGKRLSILMVILAVVLLISGWYAFDYGRVRGGFDSEVAGLEHSTLYDEIEEFRHERNELLQRVAILERSSQVDKAAAKALQRQIKVLQDEKLKLRESLAFFKDIVEGGEAVPSLRIRDFAIEELPKTGEFNVRFTIFQLVKSFGSAKGTIRITVSGVQDGEGKTLDFKALTSGKTKTRKMNFKHFQDVKEKIILPEGFLPDAIEVELLPASKKLQTLDMRYDWTPGV